MSLHSRCFCTLWFIVSRSPGNFIYLCKLFNRNMCSIGEDDFGDEGGQHAMPSGGCQPAQVIQSGGECQKCGARSQSELYKLNFRVEECRSCFLSYVRHKFRAALGAAKALPRQSEVLLHLDGSAESLVLLDMLHFAQTQNTFKRLHCQARVVYIEEAGLGENEEPIARSKLLELQARYKPFDFYIIELGSPIEDLKLLQDYTPNSTKADNDLMLDLKKMRSLTSRQDYLQQQRKWYISSLAKHLQCTHVFDSAISRDLATQLLTSIALGRGGSVALDVALLDDRLPHGIHLLRPLKDLNDQEVEFYVRAQQLTPLKHRNGNGYAQTASLQNLTSAFVANLQENYASTVSTVFRTGDKMASNHDPELLKCKNCQSALDSKLSDTLLAIEYSRLVSEAGVNVPKSGESLEHKARQRLEQKDQLCHACQSIQKDLGALL